MYSGTTLNKKSGRLMGVHQKIDRVARRHLAHLLPEDITFPSSKEILQFEGKNGPDGIKRKSPAVDEPWHFIDPNNLADTALLDMIDGHIENLTDALVSHNQQRASFEAAWLAHAVTDGLTPAHHVPFQDTLRMLRRGEGNETRTSVLKKNMMSGDTPLETLKHNWHFWGAKGAMTAHIGFEAGVASVIAYQQFKPGLPDSDAIRSVQKHGYRQYYLTCVREVADLDMYKTFISAGWTRTLGMQTNHLLMPLIIRAVVLAWLVATWEAHRRADGEG